LTDYKKKLLTREEKKGRSKEKSMEKRRYRAGVEGREDLYNEQSRSKMTPEK